MPMRRIKIALSAGAANTTRVDAKLLRYDRVEGTYRWQPLEDVIVTPGHPWSADQPDGRYRLGQIVIQGHQTGSSYTLDIFVGPQGGLADQEVESGTFSELEQLPELSFEI